MAGESVSSAPEPCSTHTTGRRTFASSSTGRATSAASVSARSRVSAFGTSSPNTTDRYVTTAKAITNEAQCGSQSPSRSRTKGSPTAPVRIPIAVIPTCTVEITRTGSSISRNAASAPLPPRARSAPRRAVTIEYSPITKKALAPIRAARARMRKRSSTV